MGVAEQFQPYFPGDASAVNGAGERLTKNASSLRRRFIFVQAFGLHTAGGGPRILRALLRDAPADCVSVSSLPEAPPPTDVAPEVHIPIRPHFGRIERTRFAGHLGYTLPIFKRSFVKRFEMLCRAFRVDGIHAVAHAPDFWLTFDIANRLSIPYYVSVHDDPVYTLSTRPEARQAYEALGRVWRGATARTVISREMGEECSRRYGEAPYEIITDGVASCAPPRAASGACRIYFAGLLALSYGPNFRALLDAMARIRNVRVSLTARGALPPKAPPGAEVIVKPWGTEAEVARDLDEVDVLYLPMPFGKEHKSFCRFSLSTKMVTYLASGLPILYHGPPYAAAARLLDESDAGIIVDSLDPGVIASALASVPARAATVAQNAAALVRSQFNLSDLRRRFWSTLGVSQ